MPESSEARLDKIRGIDRMVGRQLRKRRLELGLSQQRLAQAIGVAFQQIQKYERGTNRIVASRLYDLANVLHVNVEYFFAEAEQDTPGAAEQEEVAEGGAYPSPRETRKLVNAYHSIQDPTLRKKLINLVRSLATGES